MSVNDPFTFETLQLAVDYYDCQEDVILEFDGVFIHIEECFYCEACKQYFPDRHDMYDMRTCVSCDKEMMEETDFQNSLRRYRGE